MNWRRLLSIVLFLLSSTALRAERFSFAAFGDTPYFDFEQPLLMRMLDEMNAIPLAFVVHVGDIKSGSDRCDQAVYDNRAAWFGNSRHPFLVLPGDNDWTDCVRASNGRYDPRERLEVFRQTFHAGEFGARLAPLGIARQSAQSDWREFSENLRFQRDGVMFMSVHVVGSRNNIEDLAEFHRRQQANIAWLRAGFATAQAQQAPAVVVMMHANPMLEMAASDARRKGFAGITEALFDAAGEFGRPVLLIHGDTHHYRFEQPLRARSLPSTLRNLSRLEVHGSPSVKWTEVMVDTSQPQVFSLTQRDQ